jgi:hypothetical protein
MIIVLPDAPTGIDRVASEVLSLVLEPTFLCESSGPADGEALGIREMGTRSMWLSKALLHDIVQDHDSVDSTAWAIRYMIFSVN